MYKSHNGRARAGSARVYMCVIIMYANISPIDVSTYIDIEHEYDLHVVRNFLKCMQCCDGLAAAVAAACCQAQRVCHQLTSIALISFNVLVRPGVISLTAQRALSKVNIRAVDAER
eukprot:9345-Heterococcus_DN1.PRE.1